MKNLLLAVIAILFATAPSLHAQTNYKRFLIKSGYLEMEVKGISEGTRYIWFDNYGRMYRDELKVTTTTKIFGIKSVEDAHTLSIVDGEKFYTANLLDGTGTKHNHGVPTEFYSTYDNMSEDQKNKFADEMFNDLGGKKIGRTTFLGRECEIGEMLSVVVTMYKGVALKTKVNLLGRRNTETAIVFKENTAIDASKFLPPMNIDWLDLDALQDEDADRGDEYSRQANEADFDEPMTPVSYPFSEFKKAVGNVQYKGYKESMTMTMEGQHMANFMESVRANFVIVASSNQGFTDGLNADRIKNYQHFTHNGLSMHFGTETDVEEDSGFQGSVLLIEYPSEDMLISIVNSPKLDKDEVLKIADQLKF